MMINPNEEIENGIGGEWIVDVVCVGDNVVVVADSEKGEQFWLLLVDKLVHVVLESFTDAWGNSYVEGDVVLRGFWYDRI
jgi:hypothetical protein